MAGKSGGSWKVAYADFVTAMMAFFLVMWIGAQDAKVRQSVANYFMDPSGVNKRPVETGAVFDSLNPGPVPTDKKVASGQGIRSPSAGEPSPKTRSVMNWIDADARRSRMWRDRARKCREDAGKLAASNRTQTPEQIATEALTNQLRADLTDEIPANAAEVYKDLLFQTMADVNWAQIAEHLLAGV